MTSTENKCDEILTAINEALTEHSAAVKKAMLILECMNTNQEEYKSACRTIMTHSFVVLLLNRIKAVVESNDIKATETIIRFHSYYLHSKGGFAGKTDVVSTAQHAVAAILDGYVERFFDN